MPGTYQYDVEIKSNVAKLLSDMKQVQDRLDTVEGKEYKIKLNVDEKKLSNVISNLEKMLDSLGKGTGDFKQFENLSKELSSVVSEVQNLSKAFGKVDDSGTKTLLSSIQNIDKSLSELSQNILNVNKNMSNMGGNTSGAVKQVENITNAYQDAAKEAEKLADAQSKIGQKTNISSGMKDAFPSNEEVKQKEKLAEATRKLRQEEKQSSQDSVNSALKDQVSAWKQIQSIREKIAKVDNPDVINQLQETKRYYQQQYLDATKILKSNQDLYDAQGQLNRLKQIELETTAKISQYQSKNTESVSKYNQSLKDNATQKLSNYNNTSKYTPEFIERVNSKISEIGQLDITKPEDVARLKTIDSEVQKIVDDSKLLENKLVKQDSKIADIISQMKIFRSQNTNMSSSQKQALDDVINYAEKLANTGKVTAQQIEKIKISFSGLKAVVASSGNMGKNFFSQIGNRLTDMNSKFVAQFLSWQDWIRYIQQGVNTIRELDTAMTEVKKVSDATETQYSSFRDTISSTAKEIATTNKELLNSSADFLRLGYSLDQASDLAKNATLFVNVGDGVDITEATEDMITAMKAFDIQAEDSIKIVDDYNQIGNQFALSASDIGEAMKRSASALETGNNSFEQSIGLITAMNEIVQNSENTGNSLKVLSLRLRGAKAELEDMQEDTDGLCDSTSKLREQIKSLTGVDIMLDDNTFKSTTDIIKELGAVWDKLSDSSQAATLELIAGKSRANNVAALLKNYQRIDEVMESLGDAEGSAMRENEAIVDSIDGRIKKLSASMEDFWQKAINTDFVKNIVSSLDTILNLLTKIIDQFGLLPTIIGVGGAGTGIFKFIKNFDWVLKPYTKNSLQQFLVGQS
jgi:TP901 family phage tail tape measure protein